MLLIIVTNRLASRNSGRASTSAKLTVFAVTTRTGTPGNALVMIVAYRSPGISSVPAATTAINSGDFIFVSAAQLIIWLTSLALPFRRRPQIINTELFTDQGQTKD